MPKYNVVFQREVTEIDQVIREVEAPDQSAAYRIASGIAWNFNDECPDDTTTVSSNNCGEWKVEEILGG
jgi:hypothetical protein